jgi:sec-independent protein translocase protein TatB
MLDVGFSEILLTSAIALIVLGPERLPKVARQVGNWMGRARAMARQLSEQLEREITAEELLKSQSKPSPPPAVAPPADVAASVAPPADVAPSAAPPADVAPSAAPPADVAASVAPAPAHALEPTYGLDAASTTPSAMHANDRQVADSHTAPTDARPTHE